MIFRNRNNGKKVFNIMVLPIGIEPTTPSLPTRIVPFSRDFEGLRRNPYFFYKTMC